MIIWGALLIPILGAWVLHHWWPHRTMWWEYALPLTVCSLLVFGMKSCVEHQQVQSTEYWGSAGTEARYYEDWNEYVHRTCTCCCDEDGNNCTTYDCSYVRYHSPYWQLHTSTQEVLRISEERYQQLRQRWGNERFTDLRRNYHTNDGDLYTAVWPGDSITLEPVTTIHSYENRVKAADASIFHFRTVPPSMADSIGLFSYPAVQAPYTQHALLGAEGPHADSANKALMHWNALLGPENEVKLFVLVFRNKPRTTGQWQEWHWKGGNMNELVICLGLDSADRVQWCHPISWGTDHRLQADIRQHVETQDTLDILAFSRWLGPVVSKHFVRRDFKEFDYLTVEPSTGAVVTVYIITLLMTVFCCVFAVQNEADPDRYQFKR